jgi:hypothetical protein
MYVTKRIDRTVQYWTLQMHACMQRSVYMHRSTLLHVRTVYVTKHIDRALHKDTAGLTLKEWCDTLAQPQQVL